MAALKKDTIGAAIELVIHENGSVLDISTATGLTIYLKKPNGGAVLTKSAAFSDTGVDGKMQFVTIAGDLDLNGRYVAEPGFTLGTWVGRGKQVEFDVGDNLS